MTGLVQSLSKGYDMLNLIIAALPLPIQAFVNLVFAVLGVSFIVKVIQSLFE